LLLSSAVKKREEEANKKVRVTPSLETLLESPLIKKTGSSSPGREKADSANLGFHYGSSEDEEKSSKSVD